MMTAIHVRTTSVPTASARTRRATAPPAPTMGIPARTTSVQVRNVHIPARPLAIAWGRAAAAVRCVAMGYAAPRLCVARGKHAAMPGSTAATTGTAAA